ncbi:hypothetical protein KEM48_011565 [Puccinia striiformis f. sp. tritici PST-130]|nr:hypothetical protein KEM48_011565 [Puccinia striiformis f. sp. tritici PST-130]
MDLPTTQPNSTAHHATELLKIKRKMNSTQYSRISLKISLELLRKLNQEIRKNYPLESAAVELKPVLGTTDIKAIQNSTQSISNYIIYSNSSSSQETIEALVEIILPADLVKNKKIIHPRFTLHQCNTQTGIFITTLTCYHNLTKPNFKERTVSNTNRNFTNSLTTIIKTIRDNRVRIAPDLIHRAACYILSQITTRQPKVYKSHLSTFLHSAFRPPPIPSLPSCSLLQSIEDNKDKLRREEKEQVKVVEMVRGLVEAYTGYKHNGIYSTDKLIIWFKSLKNHQFLGRLLSTWLDEVILLRSWTGFVKAKIHYLGFNLHSKYETLLRLMKSSLNLNTSSPCLHPSLEDKDNDEDGEEDLDLDHGIMVAEILLLLALIKGHPEINEGNTPSLKEITILLDHLLLNQKAKGSGNLLT